MTRIRLLTLPTIALVAAGLAPIPSFAQPAFDGVYIARHVDAEGEEYLRAVEIERQGETFLVTWVSARMVRDAVVLEPSWIGIGIATGDTLSVGFMSGDTFGVIVFRADPDGERLTGRWVLDGEDEATRSEVLTRLPDNLPDPAVDPSDDSGSRSDDTRARQVTVAVHAPISVR